MKEKILSMAGYIARRYKDSFGEEIAEMKLHELFYFAQRVSFIRYNHPMFNEVFVLANMVQGTLRFARNNNELLVF